MTWATLYASTVRIALEGDTAAERLATDLSSEDRSVRITPTEPTLEDTFAILLSRGEADQ